MQPCECSDVESVAAATCALHCTRQERFGVSNEGFPHASITQCLPAVQWWHWRLWCTSPYRAEGRCCTPYSVLGSCRQQLGSQWCASPCRAEGCCLHPLTLGPRGNVGYTGAQALAGLKDASALHTLTLEFQCTYVGPSGAQALAGLKDATALHTLTLDLGFNNVGNNSAQALAGLKDAAALHTLTLGLRGNNVGDTVCKPLQG